MPDHREQLARNLHISSSPSSTYQAHTRHGSEEGREFSFWGSSNTIISSFLPGSHHCCSVSDPSRIKAIEEGRRELMEKMQDMPESSYELSFQDMVVDEQQVQQPDQNETSLDNTLMHSSSRSNEAQIKKLSNKKKKKNKSNNRPGQVSRVESMDSETYLLKIFFPTSLAFLKKVKVENGSKVSPRPSSLQEFFASPGMLFAAPHSHHLVAGHSFIIQKAKQRNWEDDELLKYEYFVPLEVWGAKEIHNSRKCEIEDSKSEELQRETLQVILEFLGFDCSNGIHLHI